MPHDTIRRTKTLYVYEMHVSNIHRTLNYVAGTQVQWLFNKIEKKTVITSIIVLQVFCTVQNDVTCHGAC